ncbi:MAG TPA: M20 family metallopeptidase [Candidatus Sulfomarinibacteraceae bacterium]|nr:M20 family metallopeptidase [Candidatus Sulfomarinibacteraceae bacterium]
MSITSFEARVLNCIDPVEVASFLQGLVRIKSTYPPGDCVQAARYCAALFEREGIAHEIVADLPERPSVLATLPGRQERPQLAFNAHIDTVPIEDPDAWDYDPFGGEIVEGVLYGRGAGDDKSSVTAQVMAAAALQRAGARLEGTLIVNPVADEESLGAHGAQWLRDSRRLRPDMLVVGEQTDNQVAVAERSINWVELVVYGQAAHGAMPWNGTNAIVQMAAVIQFLEREYRPLLAERTHPYLPPSSMNVGTIQGGLKTNMVPEVCRVTLDRRAPPGESMDTIMAELDHLLQRYGREVASVDYELTVLYSSGMPYETDARDPLVTTMQQALRDVTGEPRPLTGYNQGSDGRFFAGDGIPVVIFGPSHPDVGHSANEHVRLEQVVEAAQVYALTALRVLGGR